jgi:hypothetical protein
MQDQIPWQLYLFCAFQFFGFLLGLPWIRDPCKSFGKPCDPIERAASIHSALMLLALGVYFLLLTYRNRDKPEKLKRLAYFAIYCTIANLAGLLMIGAHSVTGLMNTTEHVVYVLATMILFFVLASAVSSDTPMVATAPFREGLGFNLKGVFALLAIASISWIFFNSDILTIQSRFVDTSKVSEVARMCWNSFSVLFLQVLFVYIYALAYDDDGDRAVLAMAFSVMITLNALVIWAQRKMETAGTLIFMLIYDLIFLALVLAAIARYQMELRRGDYEPLVSNA